MIDQKEPENVEYFNYLGSMIRNDERCTREKNQDCHCSSSNQKKKDLFTSKLDSYLRKKQVKFCIWSITLRLLIVEQKYLEIFCMWCWKGMENISWTDRVRNEEVLR